MPSIREAQAKVLRTGFLDTLGEGQIQTPSLSTFEAMLALYAEEFISKAQDRLNADNKVASGKLSSSIRFETKRMGRAYNLSIFVLDYYKYVDAGVQGVKDKSINSPYKFKYANPSKSHVEAIRKWIRENRSKIKVSDIKYGKTKQERKAIDPAKKERSLAYIIARSSKLKGIKGNGFWSKSFDETFKDFGVQMSKALGEDIRIDLRNAVKELKK